MLAGCGSDEPTAAEKRMEARFAEVDSTMASMEINAPPYQENLEPQTRRFVALIREYDDELGVDEVKRRLAEKASELSPYCLPCVTILDLEAEKY